MFEPLSKSLETFITRLLKSAKRGERSRRTLKKPNSYKDESDGCIDTWIEVMKLHFEEKNLSKKQVCRALTSNLDGTALNWVMAKRKNEKDSVRKNFDILLNLLGLGAQGHQAMVKFEKRRQRYDELIDKFLDTSSCSQGEATLTRESSKELSHSLEVHGRSKEWWIKNHVRSPLYLVSGLCAHAQWFAHEIAWMSAHRAEGSESLQQLGQLQ